MLRKILITVILYLFMFNSHFDIYAKSSTENITLNKALGHVFFQTEVPLGQIPHGKVLLTTKSFEIMKQNVDAITSSQPKRETATKGIRKIPTFGLQPGHPTEDDISINTPSSYMSQPEQAISLPQGENDLALSGRQPSFYIPNSNKLEISTRSGGFEIPTVDPYFSGTDSPDYMGTVGLNYHEMKHLLDDIFAGYNRWIRPRRDQSQFVFVMSVFVPLKIIAFDLERNNFTVMGYFRIEWRDDLLEWAPENYGHTKSVRIPSYNLWLPRLTISKSHSKIKKVGDTKTDVVVLHHNGYVQWWPENIYSVVCEVNVKHFPFDKQICTLTYCIADDDMAAVKLGLLDRIILSEYSENAQWDLIDVQSDIQVVRNSSVIQFHFYVKRRAGFAVYTLLVPAFLMSTLCCCTFLVPVETGEKGAIAVNVFLACMVYVTMVNQDVPKNSTEISYFVLYVIYLLGTSVFITFYTIAQSYMYHHPKLGVIQRFVKVGCYPPAFHRKLDITMFIVSCLIVIFCLSSFLVSIQL